MERLHEGEAAATTTVRATVWVAAATPEGEVRGSVTGLENRTSLELRPQLGADPLKIP
jgi:hypothetical protein